MCAKKHERKCIDDVCTVPSMAAPGVWTLRSRRSSRACGRARARVSLPGSVRSHPAPRSCGAFKRALDVATLSAIDWTMRPCVLLSLAVAVRAAGSRGPLNSGKIEHFVVLYMENRVRSCASAMCSLSVSGSGMCQWCVLTPRCLSCPPGVRPFLRMHGPARGR